MCRQDASSRNTGCIIILFITAKRTQPVTEQEGVGRAGRYQPLLPRPHKQLRYWCPRTRRPARGTGLGCTAHPSRQLPSCQDLSRTKRHAAGCRSKSNATSLDLRQKGPAAPWPAPGEETGEGGRHVSGPPALRTPASQRAGPS